MSDQLREALEKFESEWCDGVNLVELTLVIGAARRFLALTETGFDANALYDYLDEEFAISEQVGRETFLAHAYDMRNAALADYLTEEE